ncbi:hypothetical protein IB237_15395 [Agrobacterium sp. AGB01]|uniref:DUF805 domain-containing protein n=1 Tax=Agrobacterium sp. AGB01 TaxID=2769302 RepID=UPI0017842BD0|nr:hypothetical protein [Agrobacterium sp. AGB01]MBD9388567.1 hypothetical protein [Agrobacterium sp. AGB01]
MIDLLFRFQGRLTRRQYLAIKSCVGLVGGLVLIAVLYGFYQLNGNRTAIPGKWILAASPLAIPFLWASLSMQAARLRDIGVNPFTVFAVLIAVNIVCSVIVWIAPSGAFETSIRTFAKAVDLAYGLAVLFLPSDFKVGAAAFAAFNPVSTTIETSRPPSAVWAARNPPIFGTRRRANRL